MEWNGLGMEHSRAAWGPRGVVPVPPLSKECLASSSLPQNTGRLCPAFPGMTLTVHVCDVLGCLAGINSYLFIYLFCHWQAGKASAPHAA